MADIICPTCGTFNDQDAVICRECGASLTPAPAENTSMTANTFRIDSADAGGNIIIRLAPPIAAIIATLLFHQAIKWWFFSENYFTKLILPDGDWYQQIIPTLIVVLLFWVLFDLVIKLTAVISERRHLNLKPLSDLPDAISNKNIQNLLMVSGSHGQRVRRGRVFRRVSTLFGNLLRSRDTQKSHELFRHEGDLVGDEASGAYATDRLFIWAMPLLGFMGTVIGIGLAVSQFSGFLTGDIDNIELVKRELSNVAGGLSYAFDTTLLGLAASLVAMVWLSFVQSLEQRYLNRIDELGVSIVARAQFGSASAAAGSTTVVDVSDNLQNLEKAIESLQTSLDTFVTKLGESAKTFQTSTTSVTVNVTTALEGMQKDWDRHLTGFTAATETLVGKQDAFIAALAKTDTSVSEALGQSAEWFKSFAPKQLDMLTRLETRLMDSSQHLATLAEGLPKTADRSASLQTSLEDCRQAVEAATAIQKEARDAQVEICGLLRKLEGPIQIQLAPVSAPAGDGGSSG